MAKCVSPQAELAGAAADRLLSIVYRPTNELTVDSRNPRLHSKKQVRQIAASIEAFGFNVPVLIDAGSKVIAGHGRLLACELLGIKEVPTIRLEHLSETQLRAYVVADNKLTENATWNESLLAEQLKTLSEVELDFKLEAIGFEMGEIEGMVEGLVTATKGKQDPADAIPESSSTQPVTRSGDLWTLGGHRVYCGNALDDSSYQKLMSGQRAALVFTDPPYNVPIDGYTSGFGRVHHREFAMASGEMTAAEFTDFLKRAFTCLVAATREGTLHYVCMDWHHLNEILAAAQSVYSEIKSLCVWIKENAGMGSLYRSQHELVFVFKYGRGTHRNNIQLGQYGRFRTNVWRYPSVTSSSRCSEEAMLRENHPTIKPTALIADAVLDASARRDIVLDPFLGSGTTVIACQRTGRFCYGIELDPLYVDTAIRRWQAFTGESAVHEQTGRSFRELEQGNSR
jgi:DNA modification methylase